MICRHVLSNETFLMQQRRCQNQAKLRQPNVLCLTYSNMRGVLPLDFLPALEFNTKTLERGPRGLDGVIPTVKEKLKDNVVHVH